MPHQEDIEQFLFLDHTQPPRQLNAEEVVRFLDLCKRLNYQSVAGVIPGTPPKNSVAGLIRLIEMGEIHMGAGGVAGPHVLGQDGSSAYSTGGIMIYQRPQR